MGRYRGGIERCAPVPDTIQNNTNTAANQQSCSEDGNLGGMIAGGAVLLAMVAGGALLANRRKKA